jgi:bacterioferritin-associated ferredoxin
MGQTGKPEKGRRLICLCNEVAQADIEAAIMRGCDTLSKIFDATLAGVGACGGSCQPTLRKMLETYKATGKFPENPRPPSESRRQKNLRK